MNHYENEIKYILDKNNNYSTYGRDHSVDRLIKAIRKETQYKHICFNGQWGSGKTVLIHDIAQRLVENNIANSFIFNAWKYENYDDPIIALISALSESDTEIGREAYENFKKQFEEEFDIKFSFGLNFNVISAQIEGKRVASEVVNYIQSHQYYKDLEEVLVKVLYAFISGTPQKFVFFIDELDRCKPSFSMSLIERFHHMSDINGFKIVYVTDLKQLRAVVKHHYGQEYNSNIFFQKTFEKTITIPPLTMYNITDYLYGKINNNKSDRSVTNILSLVDKKNISLRSLNHIIYKVNDIDQDNKILEMERFQDEAEPPYIGFFRIYMDFFYFLVVIDELGIGVAVDILNSIDIDLLLNFLTDSKNDVTFSKLIKGIRAPDGSRYLLDSQIKVFLSDIKKRSDLFNVMSSYFI